MKYLSLSEHNKKITIEDFLILAIPISVLLIVVHLLPQNIKDILILQPANPTPISLYFSNFVHDGFDHLSVNLLNYLIYLLLILHLEINRKRLYLTAFIFLIPLPFFISLFLVKTWSNTLPMLGFSAITAAMAGYLLFSAYQYVDHYIKKSRKVSISPSLLYWPLFSIYLFIMAFFIRYRGVLFSTFFFLLSFFIFFICLLFLFFQNKLNWEIIAPINIYFEELTKKASLILFTN